MAWRHRLRAAPTGFGVAFLLLVALTLIGCVNYALSLGYGLTFLLAGVWVLAAAQALRAARDLSVTAHAGGTVQAGQLLPVTLRARGGRRGVVRATLTSTQGSAAGSVHLDSGSDLTLTLPTTARGPLDVHVSLRALDRLGLWQVPLPQPDPLTVLIHPSPEPGAPPPPERALPGQGDGAGRGPGDEDFSGLRPYQPGDSPRQVSWRHVARTGQLLTRETDAAQGRARLLDWHDAPGDPEARAARLSAWVHALHGQDQAYALHLPTETLPTGTGDLQRQAALNALALQPPLPAPRPPARMAAPPLDGRALLWTLLALTVTLAPGALRQPWWLTGLIAALLAHTVLRARSARITPLPTWLLGLLAVAGGAALNATYGTLLGRDAGTAFLAFLAALKAAESHARRDQAVLTLLGLFVTSTGFFFSQGPVTALYAVACAALLLTAASTRLGAAPPLTRAELSARLTPTVRLLALAAPLTVALFVLFPRPDAPLWQLPVQSQNMTGLNNEVSAGSFTNLAQSADVAFRADFQGALPPPAERYWRGPVLEAFDGLTWRQIRGPGPMPSIEATGAPVTYDLTLEPSGTPWLLGLDAVVRVPQGAFITSAFQAVTPRTVSTRRRVTLVSQPALLGRQESQDRLNFTTALPGGQNPRTLALARPWQALPPQERVQAALAFLRQGNFTYTLNPPLLPQQNRTDAFLFASRQGFCEHYASAFAVLMRAAGLSARVVTGYLGGEVNPDGNYLIVRQRDAHAWTEVWLPGRGWVRVDPTAAIAPARVNADLSTALSQPTASAARPPGQLERLRLKLDTWQNRWNTLIVEYDGEQQTALLSRLGVQGGAQTLWWLVLPALLLTLLPAYTWMRRPARPTDPAQRLWQDLTRLLGEAHPGETPSTYAQRQSAEHPHLAAPLRDAVTAYQTARYAPGEPDAALSELRGALRALRGMRHRARR
ncbi:transglutaminaseTgpA domain-containing protein [Deinococcus radiotolerans]|uniref:Transglutaminase n=1 Tax=Deinococcus radiotolerans TaxID=1309407 RepID=A0ABQ2FFI9_9DEIO|nr:transglutaminaseTgpA domain-containing protein [Deinococcus radiotolerans]GGK86357.1 transglutaminase [Deinococcus radiotolerans]